MKENITKYMRKSIIIGLLLVAAMPLAAQESNFDQFKQQQNDKFDKFKTDQQAEFDAFRKRMNHGKTRGWIVRARGLEEVNANRNIEGRG